LVIFKIWWRCFLLNKDLLLGMFKSIIASALTFSVSLLYLPNFGLTNRFLYFTFLSYYCCIGSTLWHLQKFLQYIIVQFTASMILLYSSSHLLLS
jgi:hypothetical protein